MFICYFNLGFQESGETKQNRASTMSKWTLEISCLKIVWSICKCSSKFKIGKPKLFRWTQWSENGEHVEKPMRLLLECCSLISEKQHNKFVETVRQRGNPNPGDQEQSNEQSRLMKSQLKLFHFAKICFSQNIMPWLVLASALQISICLHLVIRESEWRWMPHKFSMDREAALVCSTWKRLGADNPWVPKPQNTSMKIQVQFIRSTVETLQDSLLFKSKKLPVPLYRRSANSWVFWWICLAHCRTRGTSLHQSAAAFILQALLTS